MMKAVSGKETDSMYNECTIDSIIKYLGKYHLILKLKYDEKIKMEVNIRAELDDLKSFKQETYPNIIIENVKFLK